MAYVKSKNKTIFDKRKLPEPWYPTGSVTGRFVYSGPDMQIVKRLGRISGKKADMLIIDDLSSIDYRNVEKRMMALMERKDPLRAKRQQPKTVAPRESWDLDQVDWYADEDWWGNS